MAQEEVSIQRN